MLIGHRRLRLVFFAVLAASMFTSVVSARAAEFEFEGAFGPDGTSLSGFESAGAVAVDQEEKRVYVLDRSAGTLFKFDFDGKPVAFTGSAANLSGNELKGLAVGGGPGTRQVAVDSSRHIIYLTGGVDFTERATSLQAFEADGDPSLFTAGPGKESNEIAGFPNLRGVAVDTSGNIYVSGSKDSGNPAIADDVSVYRPNGSELLPSVAEALTGAKSLPAPGNIAVDVEGRLYALVNLATVERFTPSEYPITAATNYTRSAEPVDPNQARSVAVNPFTNQLFVVDLPEGTARVAVFDEEGNLEATFGGPGQPGELDIPDGIGIAVESPDIAKPFVAQDPVGEPSQVKIFREKVTPAKPTIELTFATAVTGDSAVLNGKVNPNNLSTEYWFEYGLSSCEVEECTKVPLDDGVSIGQGRKGVSVSQPITSLSASTPIYYRVVAKNELGKTDGPTKVFVTQGSGLGFALGDSRAWEMVSPSNKFDGTLFSSQSTAIQASVAGDKLVYASRGSIVERPQGNRLLEPSTVLAKRNDQAEWNSEDLTPPHSEASRVEGGTEYKIFTEDLLKAAMEPRDGTPLSPESSEETPYIWLDGEPPSFTPLVNASNVPPGTEFGPLPGSVSGHPLLIEGATSDLSQVVFRSEGPSLVGGAVPGSVYIWDEGSLEAVSKLPSSEEGGAIVKGMLGSGRGSVRHAISEDGSRVFWTPGISYQSNGIFLPALYMRDRGAGETVRLDLKAGGSGEGEEHPAFNAASADGDVVFFTDSQQLTSDASPSGRDLYRCEIGDVGGGLGCVELTDVSAPKAGSGESAEVLDQVSALSEDGTRMYFVARGVLDEDPNQEGEAATSGAPNLYYWREGQGVQFIAGLSERDYPVWGGLPKPGFAVLISAQASPTGRFFTFTSERSLTGYENRNGSGKLTTQVFVYDSDADEAPLTCASCNPSGAAAVGEQILSNVQFFPPDPAQLWRKKWASAILPEATQTETEGRSLYRPRSMLDNGRVFFNSVDPLVAADTNGNWDVYQYEPVGVGSCTPGATSAALTASGEGCVGLLSSGTSEGDAGFLDSSLSGNDVFFLTKGRLSVLDQDSELDAYDARVNGVPAVLEPVQECAGESCQPTVGPPNDPTPASEAFVAPQSKKKCRKGQRLVHRKGRAVCVRKKHKKHGKHHKKQGHKSRGAQR
jgi:hypothetical protein